MLRLVHPQKQAAACLSFAYHFFAPYSERRFTHSFCVYGQGLSWPHSLSGQRIVKQKSPEHGDFNLKRKTVSAHK
jgi:hypothetical protein